METLQKLQKIALDLNIDISDCQDIDCMKKRINEATAFAVEELRKEYEEQIEKENIAVNEYKEISAKNLRKMITEEAQIINNKKRDENR